MIIACDEAGRGPLAGPVVVAGIAVDFKKEVHLAALLDELKNLGVSDSKKINSKKRQEIISKLTKSNSNSIKIEVAGCTLFVKIEFIEARIIDEINILQASLLGMKKASNFLNKKKLSLKSPLVLLDGNKSFEFDPSQLDVRAIVKGDQKSVLIGLASIFAKEKRDQIMLEYDRQYPQYGFKKHYGYPTKEHQKNLQKYGHSPIHRQSFRLIYE